MIKERLARTGVDATVIQDDFMNVNLSTADVVAIYLSASVNEKLGPKLMNELGSGARVVSLDYELPGWKEGQSVKMLSGGVSRKIYLYEMA